MHIKTPKFQTYKIILCLTDALCRTPVCLRTFKENRTVNLNLICWKDTVPRFTGSKSFADGVQKTFSNPACMATPPPCHQMSSKHLPGVSVCVCVCVCARKYELLWNASVSPTSLQCFCGSLFTEERKWRLRHKARELNEWELKRGWDFKLSL